MAYKNLIDQACTDPTEVFKHVRDFICKRNGSYDYSVLGVGWTLHDSYYAVDQHTISANDYFVIYSSGESGLKDLYFKFVYVSSTAFVVLGYLYWNNTTHAGVSFYGRSDISWTMASSPTLWLYADMDSFVGLIRSGTSYYATFGGTISETPLSQAVTSPTAAITAGSNVVVTFTSVPIEWIVGTYLFVQDTANIERVVITVISGNDVTFQTFLYSYASTCKFCMTADNYVFDHNNTVYSQISHNGFKGLNLYISNVHAPSSTDVLSGLAVVYEIFLYTASHWEGPLKNMYAGQSVFVNESVHQVGSDWYRKFLVNGGSYILLREV